MLKDYLLKGHAINHRIEKVENDVFQIKEKVNEIEFQVNTNLPPNEGIFFNGQIFDAWQFVSRLIKEAKETVILIDNYIDESVLMLLSKRNPGVKAAAFTGNISKQLETDLKKHNKQYRPIEIKLFTKAHDRFLIIDQTTVYHIGASLKDLGKKTCGERSRTMVRILKNRYRSWFNPQPITKALNRTTNNKTKKT